MPQSKAIINTSFWTDSKVDRLFSSEDKYFAMYLLSNSYINRLGIFELPIKQAAAQLGWSEDQVLVLIERFETKYHFLKYSKETGEIAIKNRLKYLDRGGKPILDELRRDKANVKDKYLLRYLSENLAENRSTLNKTVIEFLDELAAPTIDEIRQYCMIHRYSVNPIAFFKYYNEKGWKLSGGMNVATCWKAKLKEWQDRESEKKSKNRFNNFKQRNYDYEKLEHDLLNAGGDIIE